MNTWRRGGVGCGVSHYGGALLAELEEVGFINDGPPAPPPPPPLRVDDVTDADAKSFCDVLRLPVLRRMAVATLATVFILLPPEGDAAVTPPPPLADLRRLSRMSLSWRTKMP